MRTPGRWRYAAGLMAMALAVTACTSDGTASSTEDDATDDTSTGDGDGDDEEEVASGELRTVRVASLAGGLLTVTGPLDVAEELGLFEEAGIELEFVETAGGGAIVQAVLAGEADIGTQTGATAVISAFSQGADLRMIASAYNGFDGVWVGPVRDDIAGPEDMGGEVIGFSSPGASSQVAAEALAAGMVADGLDPIRAEAIGGTSDQLTAAETGQILAAYANPPVGLDEVDEGTYDIFFNAFDDLPEYADVSTRVTFTTQAFLDADEELASTFLDVLQQAWDVMFAEPEQACEIWLERSDLPYSTSSCVETLETFYTPEQVAVGPIGGLRTTLDDGLAYDAIDRDLEPDEIETLVVDLRN